MKTWVNPEIEKWRVSRPPFTSTAADGNTGLFRVEFRGTWLKVISSDGEGWHHVSVSKPAYPFSVPSWEQMCFIKNLFFGEDVWACQFHPSKADYVNHHPGCLHLWRCLDREMPTPPAIMVGPK